MSPEGELLEQQLPQIVARFATLTRTRARRQFVRRNPWVRSRGAVDRLYEEVIRQARIDIRVAKNLALAIQAIGAESKDEYCEAQSLRAGGHILYAQARYPDAISRYEEAADVLRRLRCDDELGRTLSSAIHALIYVGRYDQALAWAAEARTIFERRGDSLRLARLDTNVGNLLYRQDRFAEALELYRRAYEEFSREATPQDIAAALSNLAVCYNSLGQFDQALDAYRRAREHCARHGMSILIAEADYNIASLHFLRGEYQRAITLFEQARTTCKRFRDPYHAALCDLDEAELYLELNMVEKGAELARSAFLRFGRLQMRYERAKALVFRAVAASRSARARSALRLFAGARALFAREKNFVWLASIDLYRAMVLFDLGSHSRSRRLCGAALRVFSSNSLAAKAALCRLMLARLDIVAGRPDRAGKLAEHTAAEFDAAATPALAWQAYFVLGQALEMQGDKELAAAAYRSSHSRLERLRSHLRGQGLKIAFLKDKLEVYESLVWLALDGTVSEAGDEAAFRYIEQAKSRSLADLISAGGTILSAPHGDPETIREIRALQERLNFYNRQIELHEMSAAAALRASLQALREETLRCEDQLSELLRRAQVQLDDREFASLQGAGSVSTGTIQSSLGPDTVLVEYYEARNFLFACVLSRERIRIFRLCPTEEARHQMMLLQFQLAKFGLGAEYTKQFAALLLGAARAHLQSLYDLLIAPLCGELRASHLVIVPHGFLHYLPFPALYNGDRYLTDDFAVSSAPSASIYHLCRSRGGDFANSSLILGVADRFAPGISDEVRKVASRLPGPALYMNEEATVQRLRLLGPGRRFIHIATHGFYRQDNPMLSCLRLGDSDLTLMDVYGLHLPTDLITLSGCGTGLQSIVGGDELVGLVRGFLYAGAQSVMVSLWDVNDESTSEYMDAFYSALPGTDKAEAVRVAMRTVRERHPHPYYWAPFTLIGNT